MLKQTGNSMRDTNRIALFYKGLFFLILHQTNTKNRFNIVPLTWLHNFKTILKPVISISAF